jgi:hypothetical protein
MTILVALSLLLLAPADQAMAQTSIQADRVQASVPDSATLLGQSDASIRRSQPAMGRMDPQIFLHEDANQPTCLKIRAYVFALNDDHAPRFIRETTCLNAKPRAKSVDRADPLLSPALRDAALR